jgi:homoaconitate hydratase family protein
LEVIIIGLTITEKIIASKLGINSVLPGHIHEVPVDLAFIHDNNAPITISQFARLPQVRIWDPGKVHFVLDHHSPATTTRAAQHHQNIREFAKKFGAKVWEVGRGVSHPVMAEEGNARPGRVIVGTDSHTVGLGTFGCLSTGIGSTEMAAVFATGRIWMQVPETVKVIIEGKLPPGVCARDVALFLLKHFGPSFLNYAAVEFYGSLIEELSVEERMAITTMTLEMGVKNAIMPVDAKTLAYIGDLREGDQVFAADPDARYASVLQFDVSGLEPVVATPGLPTNGVSVADIAGTEIHQATLGSCSGAYYHDLEQAAAIVKGRKVHPGVRFIIVPNSSRVIERAAKTGILATLHEAGAIISSPACGTCAGYEVGCLAPGEVCISSTTRNMDGRMGPGGIIYLAGALTVAASALEGRISDPRRYLGGDEE